MEVVPDFVAGAFDAVAGGVAGDAEGAGDGAVAEAECVEFEGVDFVWGADGEGGPADFGWCGAPVVQGYTSPASRACSGIRLPVGWMTT